MVSQSTSFLLNTKMHIYSYMYIFLCPFCYFYASYPAKTRAGLSFDLVRNANDKVKAEVHSRFEVKKALGALKEEHKELGNKLTVAKRERSNALADLKNAEAQAKDQHKLLYTTKIELAT